MELFTLVAGLFLPWLLGVVWLRAPWLRASGITWPTLLGYGYLGGILLTTLVMRLLDAVGIRLGFFSIGLALLLLIVAGAWLGRGEPWRIRWPGIDFHSLAGWRKIVYAVVLANQEDFTLVTNPLSSGSHTIEVQAVDRAGNSVTKDITVTAP